MTKMTFFFVPAPLHRLLGMLLIMPSLRRSRSEFSRPRLGNFELPSEVHLAKPFESFCNVAGEEVGADVGEAVGLLVGAPVGAPVGVPVGLAVGGAVGRGVGPGVGSLVGRGVGRGVGSGVGSGVGRGVGAKVGLRVVGLRVVGLRVVGLRVVGRAVGGAVGGLVGDGVGIGVGAGVSCTPLSVLACDSSVRRSMAPLIGAARVAITNKETFIFVPTTMYNEPFD